MWSITAEGSLYLNSSISSNRTLSVWVVVIAAFRSQNALMNISVIFPCNKQSADLTPCLVI